MSEAAAPNALPTTTITVGSTSSAGGAGEAEFSATMSAVVTVNISEDDETDETQGASAEETAAASEDGNIEIEIEITTFEGGDLLENLSVTSSRGDAEVEITIDGDVGVSTEGGGPSENLQVQMGETLTFTVPDQLSDVQGGTITFTNLLNDENGAESALVVAYDSEGKEVFRCLVGGDQSGDVSVDINVTFSSVDFKPVDNGAWLLGGNSDFFINKIDIVTGNAFQGSGVNHANDPFAYDYLQFFQHRNFLLRNTISNTSFRNSSDAFRNIETKDKSEQAAEAEALKTTLNSQRNQSMHRIADVEGAEQRFNKP